MQGSAATKLQHVGALIRLRRAVPQDCRLVPQLGTRFLRAVRGLESFGAGRQGCSMWAR